MDDQKLMEYFKFDEADLEANRYGQLTAKQMTNLRADDKQGRIILAIIGIILLAFMAFMIYLFGWKLTLSFDIGKKVLADAVGLVLVGGVGLLAVRAFRAAFAKFQVKVQKVEGPVNIVKERRMVDDRHYYVYEMHIGDETFEVDSDLASIMLQGDVYAVYSVEGSEDEILSAELVSKAK